MRFTPGRYQPWKCRCGSDRLVGRWQCDRESSANFPRLFPYLLPYILRFGGGHALPSATRCVTFLVCFCRRRLDESRCHSRVAVLASQCHVLGRNKGMPNQSIVQYAPRFIVISCTWWRKFFRLQSNRGDPNWSYVCHEGTSHLPRHDLAIRYSRTAANVILRHLTFTIDGCLLDNRGTTRCALTFMAL
jgi:hypothetical protein